MLIVLLGIMVVTGVAVCYRPAFIPAEEQPFYPVTASQDDTLRVIMIGDSWVHIHERLRGDSILYAMLQPKVSVPVKVMSRGRGGANSKEIYYYMFSAKGDEYPGEADRCTQPLIEQKPDYCIISAGINDVVQGKGVDFYCHNYLLILRLLLHQGIRPVVLELPTVVTNHPHDYHFFDISDENLQFLKEQITYKFGYGLAALINGADRNKVDGYRHALRLTLEKTGLIDSVLYIGINEWNPDGYRDSRQLYVVEDYMHLNLKGYYVLDSCYAAKIAEDWK